MMDRIPLTDEVTYMDYVFQDGEMAHSGILSNAYRLNPAYNYTFRQRYESFFALTEYANYSITAYRAFEWWAAQPDYMPFPDLKASAQHELKRLNKPKTFMRISAEVINLNGERNPQS